MKSTASMDRQTFLNHLRESKLLGRREFQELVGRLPDSDRARVLARTLVEWGILTRFQAELLLAGRYLKSCIRRKRMPPLIGSGECARRRASEMADATPLRGMR